ncbi:hypothetical protein CYY_004329 [Polysphondylium violaceum]|uniref:Uncharacterized protein n=1 Tax=Polysphondylium violaceum TaxID=133409 RepID=A0A8J4V0E5_9MYCE|nr:hypothetical protein CYY_004329 [Polysphondylium violaceum]
MSTETQINSPTNSQGYNWGIWKADWKQWWGSTLGWESLEKQGLEERKKLTPNPRGTPLKKGNSSSEDVSIGVHGGKIDHPATVASFLPEWKYPAFERNKYDDELLRQKIRETPKEQVIPTKEYVTGHPKGQYVTGTPSN